MKASFERSSLGVVVLGLVSAACLEPNAVTLEVQVHIARECDGGCQRLAGELSPDVAFCGPGGGVGSSRQPAWIVTSAGPGELAGVVVLQRAVEESTSAGRARSWRVGEAQALPTVGAASVVSSFSGQRALYGIAPDGGIVLSPAHALLLRADGRTLEFRYQDEFQTVTERHEVGEVVRRPLERIAPDDWRASCCAAVPGGELFTAATLLVLWRRRGAKASARPGS